jgi:flagellar biosynthesis/type III secretory pathway protein FliH
MTSTKSVREEAERIAEILWITANDFSEDRAEKDIKLIEQALTAAYKRGFREGALKSAKVAESMAMEIIDMQTGLRSNPALNVSKAILKLIKE